MTTYKYAEKLISEIANRSVLQYLSESKDSTITFIAGPNREEMFVTLTRKQTSSEKAKQVRYNYSFKTNFIFGPERKRFTVKSVHSRSYADAVRKLTPVVLARVIQHFDVKDESERKLIRSLAFEI